MSMYKLMTDSMDEQPGAWRSEIPIKLLEGGRASNVERSGYRDMTVSTMARPIGEDKQYTDNLRHIDSDLRQTCTKCSLPTVLIEDSTDDTKRITYTSALAEALPHTVFSVRLIHDRNRDVPIRELKIVENGTKVVLHQFGVEWSEWQIEMENIQLAHERFECRGKTPRAIVRK